MENSTATRITAIIVSWNPDRYFAFAYPDYGYRHLSRGDNVYIHGTKFDQAGIRLPKVGDKIEVLLGSDHLDRVLAVEVFNVADSDHEIEERPADREEPAQHYEEFYYARNGNQWRVPLTVMSDGRKVANEPPECLGSTKDESNWVEDLVELREDKRFARLSQRALQTYNAVKISSRHAGKRVPVHSQEVADFAGITEHDCLPP